MWLLSHPSEMDSRVEFNVPVSHRTELRSFRRRSSQPITWLIMTNKTVQDNTQTKYNSEKQTTQNTAKESYHGSVDSCDDRPGNEKGLFYNAPKPTHTGLPSAWNCCGTTCVRHFPHKGHPLSMTNGFQQYNDALFVTNYNKILLITTKYPNQNTARYAQYIQHNV